MATEAVNGMEYNQYGQPAELAASTPSQQAQAGSQNTNAASGQQKADPQEIGWYFVEQYYTTLSKSPDKIHLFYNKKSQLITGTEAEKVLPAVGSKAISEKIKSLDLQECKIRVLNVDSQASYDNIVVQVIGEMSNKNQPHHKFVQTFILATQPNGYFVLNDIFRYLSADEDEIVEDEPAAEDVSAAEQAPGEAVPITTPARVEENVNTERAAEQVDEKLNAAVEEPSEPVEEVNGVEPSVADTEEPKAEVDAEPQVETTPADVAEEPTSTPAVVDEVPVEPDASEADVDSTPAASAPAAADVPPAKKTWASMVGIRAPVVPAIPQAQTQAQPQPQAAAPTPTQAKPKAVATSQTPPPKSSEAGSNAEASTPTSQNGWQEAGKKTKQQSKTAQEGIVHAYIKNVNEKIDARVLREELEKYGKLKYYDVSRPKQCAFVEFEDAAAYAAAVAENPHTVNGEAINVEERRPRPGTQGGFNTTYNRAGGNAGRGRGGLQQRSGSQGAAGFNRDTPTTNRGNFQAPRGSKPTGPARGRGQTQAAA